MTEKISEFRPPRRRVFAFDPSTARNFANRKAREVTISIPHEMDTQDYNAPFIGPSGAYVEVVDVDPASNARYTPIDLNADHVCHNNGLAPSPENPQFHQQMVYAVVMNTISVFEEALGRVVHWAPVKGSRVQKGKDGKDETVWFEEYTEKLRIYPHALREANAFYDPKKRALLFGYFSAPDSEDGPPAGTTVFTCLSHDIIVHETVHAILDGMHPHFAENANSDQRALHEAFSDIVALFQMFSYPEVLEDQIAKTKGDLSKQNMLGELAQEFGKALGRGHALRNFLGETDENGEWQPLDPDPRKFYEAEGAHARGAVLVAAVFKAFLTIYTNRVRDLFRIASNGSGVLRQGDIDPDLKRRLASEAAQCARRVMRICIRAMDYLPPVNVDFGSYLRAIITADHDLFPEDKQGYRDAFVEAFAAWGILPRDLPVLSVNALLWPTLSEADRDRRIAAGTPDDAVDTAEVKAHLGMLMSDPNHLMQEMRFGPKKLNDEQRKRRVDLFKVTEMELEKASEFIKNDLIKLEGYRHGDRASAQPFREAEVLTGAMLEIGSTMDRKTEHRISNYYKRLLWFLLHEEYSTRFAKLIGIEFDGTVPATVRRSGITGRPSLHARSVRIAKRVGQRGQLEREYVIELVQTRRGYLDPAQQAEEDARPPSPDDNYRGEDFKYRAGVTFLIDARSYEIRRLIRTPFTVSDPAGLEAQRRHLTGESRRPNNAFFEGNTAGAEAAFTDLHRSAAKKDHFG